MFFFCCVRKKIKQRKWDYAWGRWKGRDPAEKPLKRAWTEPSTASFWWWWDDKGIIVIWFLESRSWWWNPATAESEVCGGASSRTEEGQGVEEKIWWRKSSWSNVAGDWRWGEEEEEEGVKREEFMAFASSCNLQNLRFWVRKWMFAVGKCFEV